MTMIRVEAPALTATINPLGAELTSLRDAEGRELMTDGDPAYWTGRAPLLFPIVGGLVGDRYRLDGKDYALPRHGFARRMDFALIAHQSDRAVLRLTDTEATRAVYPFAFTFDAEFRIEGHALVMALTVTNRSERDMPASLGYHPAFAWPLPYGQPRAAHRILFDEVEPDSLALLGDGLIVSGDRPSPVAGRMLALEDALFTDDALIWTALRSRGCLYGAADAPQLRLDWSDMPSLGLWTKPGAGYVCIEPWDGHADPAGFTGEIWEKPGIRRIAPGESVAHWMRVTLPR